MPIDDELRKAIANSGESAMAISKKVGVSQTTIWRFIQGNDIRLGVADKLCNYFGIEVIVRAKATKPTGSGKPAPKSGKK